MKGLTTKSFTRLKTKIKQLSDLQLLEVFEIVHLKIQGHPSISDGNRKHYYLKQNLSTRKQGSQGG